MDSRFRGNDKSGFCEFRLSRLLFRREIADELRQDAAQVVAVGDHVEHSVVKQIFRGLESLGQFFTDCLFNHAASGEGQCSARLGNMNIA